jgi:cellobiose phosphorylase
MCVQQLAHHGRTRYTKTHHVRERLGGRRLETVERRLENEASRLEVENAQIVSRIHALNPQYNTVVRSF